MRSVGGVAGLLLALGGLGSAAGCSGGVSLVGAAEGPLSAMDVAGGNSVLEPKPRTYPWRASFGIDTLCSENGAAVHLERVRVPGDPDPVDTRVFVHAKRPGATRAPYDFYSAKGSPPDWSESYADVPRKRIRQANRFLPVAGSVISQPCPGGLLSEGYRGLVIVLEADQRGADVPQIFVDYRVGEDEYTLTIDWQIILCGTQVREHCEGDPRVRDSRPPKAERSLTR